MLFIIVTIPNTRANFDQNTPTIVMRPQNLKPAVIVFCFFLLSFCTMHSQKYTRISNRWPRVRRKSCIKYDTTFNYYCMKHVYQKKEYYFYNVLYGKCIYEYYMKYLLLKCGDIHLNPGPNMLPFKACLINTRSLLAVLSQFGLGLGCAV